MLSPKQALQLLFVRPLEPIFMPRGDKYNLYSFQVPDQSFGSEYIQNKKQIKKKIYKKNPRFIRLEEVCNDPDISLPQQLKLDNVFSLYIEKHKNMAARLIDAFMEQTTISGLISLVVHYHHKINPYLLNYSLSVAVLHRHDTLDIAIPNILESFPAKFFDSATFAKIRARLALTLKSNREPIVVESEMTTNLLEPEQSLAYFREDVGINLHHAYWYLKHPDNTNVATTRRRGELFYYMHRQILARYDTERLAAYLDPVRSWDSFEDAIDEGFFPKMDISTSNRSWVPRFPNVTVEDVTRPADGIFCTVECMQTWRDNIINAVIQGYVQDINGRQISLCCSNGIDILGNIIEASSLSPNKELYGNYHNCGQIMIGFCHDPHGRFLEDCSVMGDPTTAMRDPAFYRWHKHIDDIFSLHKNTLAPYSIEELQDPHLRITDVRIIDEAKKVNFLTTFWQQSEVNVSNGLNFASNISTKIRFSHLQHEKFFYVIKIKNASEEQQVIGLIRIFMAPKFDSKSNLMSFEEQRKFMIELDKFKAYLHPGNNVIARRSTESSVTTPFRSMLKKFHLNPADSAKSDICSYKWPQHMLIPKGTQQMMQFDLFVMISEHKKDANANEAFNVPNTSHNLLFHDNKAMGFPFDRVGRPGILNLRHFLTSNMITQEVLVRFENRTADRPKAINRIAAVQLCKTNFLSSLLCPATRIGAGSTFSTQITNKRDKQIKRS